jgi:nudix-type nucleoside diphosphatase (YffH/AdpP family)
MAIEITGIETLHQGWARLLIVTIRLPGGETIRREVEDHGRAVCVLPYDPQRRTAVLVRQFRAPPFLVAGESETVEAIAGIVEDGDPARTAEREAREEAGLRLRGLEHVVTAWTMPGLSTERMDFYLATYGATDRVADGGGLANEHENIVVVEMQLADLADLADKGRLTDTKTLLLVQTLRLRHPDLFGGDPVMV